MERISSPIAPCSPCRRRDTGERDRSSQSRAQSGVSISKIRVSGRTPLHSPRSTPYASQCQPRSRDLWSQKRCFSPDAFELGRRVVSNNSTANVAVSLPNKLRLEIFGVQEKVEYKRYRTTIKEYRDEKARTKRERILPIGNVLVTPTPKRNAEVEPCLSLFSITNILHQQTSFRNTTHSTEGFPWDEWARTSFSVGKFREILTSGRHLLPVTVIETEEHIFIKLVSPKRIQNQISTSSSVHCSMYEIIKFPFLLPFKVISGVFKWIISD